MDSQMWHQPPGFVGGGFRKGTKACLFVWEKTVPQLSPWWQTLHFLPVSHWCLSSLCPGPGAKRDWVWLSPCVHSGRGTAWDSRSFFYPLNLYWFCSQELLGAYLPGTGTLLWGAWCGPGTPCSWDTPPKFLSTTHGYGTSPFRVWAPTTSQDGCGFFNSIVVRLPFNSTSDSSEWWWFSILVVILMWLCLVSLVCLCCYRDWKSWSIFWYVYWAFFGEVSVCVFDPFCNWGDHFLVSLKGSLCILNNNSLSDMSFANIFFPVCGLSYSLDSVFCIVEVFSF